jgi:Phage integrase, N-terminal SAM-like domain
MSGRRTSRTHTRDRDWDAAFFQAFEELLTISDRGQGRRHRPADLLRPQKSRSGLCGQIRGAREALTEKLRHEAYRRALEGVERPVFYRGEEVGVVREHSDRMLEGLLRAPDPAWRTSRVEVREDPEAAQARARPDDRCRVRRCARRAGVVRSRSRDPYKPATIRGYEKAMRLRVLDELGDVRLSEITRNDLQDLADRWLASGLSPSTVGCTITPLQALYRRALARGDVSVDPTAELELPAIRRGEQQIASSDEAARLIDALAIEDRGLWATALYGGCGAASFAACAGPTSTWPAADPRRARVGRP